MLETTKHETTNANQKEQKHQQHQQPKYFYRKLQSVAKGISLSVTLPKQYVVDLGLIKDGFVKMSKQNGKIIVEIAT